MEKRFYAVSNAHMDTQWNWTVQDTIRDYIKNTLEDNFRNFLKAPKYLFNFEGAFKYKLMAEYYPEHYKKLKAYIAEGRWMPSGAFWDSCDVNVPSSEALMRQALLGNNYFEKEFGIFTKDIFLPDCFGFRASIPSIARHMGLIGFSTQKLAWGVGCPIVNDDGSVTRPEIGDFKRMDLGKWRGPDGKEIYVSLDGGAYVYQFHESDTPVDKRDNIAHAIARNADVSHVPYRMQYFGVGDRGGACETKCAEMVSDAEESTDGMYRVINAHTYRIFEDLEEEGGDLLPVYEGQLHIPHGFGALTSHTVSKRFNRLCENLGDAAERASILASLTAGKSYPQEKLNDAWKTFLWHQFHDDITGTSICSAYVFSHNDYAIALNQFAAELTASIGAVAATLNTDVIGTPIVLFNSLGHPRTDIVAAEINTNAKFVRVFDENGKELPSQLLSENGKTTVIFEATLPAVGVAVVDVRDADTAYHNPALTVSENTLENPFYRVTLDQNGDIASVFDKTLDKELLSASSRLEISPDNSSVWPSWELEFSDLQKEHSFVSDVRSIEISEKGGARVALKVTRTHGASTFVQTISLAANGKVVTVDNYVDWNSRNSLLKASFPLTAQNPIAEFDLGLGTDKGQNTDTYPYFQHCVHTYADLTDTSGDYGIAILNDSKYGMDKPDDHTLRLTLIHTPASPYGEEDSHQDWQDFGRNEFSYGITSHKGVRDGIALLAERFNKPIYPFSSDKHSGKESLASLVASSDSEVLVRCVKKEENGDRIIIRVQEMAGRDHEAIRLTFARKLLSAIETDGYERDLSDISFTDDSMTFPLSHYEPKTFAVTLAEETAKSKTRFTPVALDYTHKITTDNHFGNGESDITLPAELFPETVISSDIPFTLGNKDALNVLSCHGQTIALPEGTKTLYLLANTYKSSKDFRFHVKDSDIPVKISNFREHVGTWDMIAKNNTCYLNRDEIAAVYTHTHDRRGEDRYYEFAYLFKYALDVDGAETITLPNDPTLLIYAMTASTEPVSCKALSPLYPIAEKKTGAKHTLTIENGLDAITLCAGEKILLTAPDNDPESIFDHWEGDAIVTANAATILVEMPDCDNTVKVVRRYLGKNLSYKKKAEASISENADETPDHAVNGIYNEKWCGLVGEEGAWMSVDLGSIHTVNRWLVKHAGAIEGSPWNTADFSLAYRLEKDGEWITADTVIGNTEDVTLRDVTPFRARYVRLFVTKPSQGDDGDPHARIFEFSVFEA